MLTGATSFSSLALSPSIWAVCFLDVSWNVSCGSRLLQSGPAPPPPPGALQGATALFTSYIISSFSLQGRGVPRYEDGMAPDSAGRSRSISAASVAAFPPPRQTQGRRDMLRPKGRETTRGWGEGASTGGGAVKKETPDDKKTARPRRGQGRSISSFLLYLLGTSAYARIGYLRPAQKRPAWRLVSWNYRLPYPAGWPGN